MKPPTLPSSVEASIRALVEYLWCDEERHYAETACDGDAATDHVFLHLQRVRTWLDSTD